MLHTSVISRHVGVTAQAAKFPQQHRTSVIARSKSSKRKQQSGPYLGLTASEERLVRELNSSHMWLPNEQDDEFGLDDVAAHITSRSQPQVFTPSAASQKGKKKGKGRGMQQAAATAASLSDVNAGGKELPNWVERLRGDGFDIMGRSGELFLQRGAVQPTSSNRSTRAQDSSRSKSSSSSKPRSASSSNNSQPEHTAVEQQPMTSQQRSGASTTNVPDSNLAVRREFDTPVWQQCAAGDGADTSIPNTSVAAAWYAEQVGSTQSNSSEGTHRAAAARPSTSRLHAGASTWSKPLSSAAVQQHLKSFNSPEQLLQFLESQFATWSQNGCWLADQRKRGVVTAPTPAEAAAALKGVALAAKRAAYSAMQTQGLARDRRVLGLVECLRLTPPRSAPHQPRSLQQRLWSVAKAYWLQAGAVSTAARQQLLAASCAAPGAKLSDPHQQQHDQQAAQLDSSSAGDAPALGPLLAALQLAGVTHNKAQPAATRALRTFRQEDQLRQKAFVDALWGMSVIGGPLFFQQEMDALCEVAAVGRWKLATSELADVLWGLANARHWSALLSQLESALLAAGGVAACSAPSLITALWAFATLDYTPKQLLVELHQKGWCVKLVQEVQQQAQRNRHQQSPADSDSQQAQPGSDQTQCRLYELSSGQLTSLVWSLACLQQVEGQLFKQVWAEVCRRGPSLAKDQRHLIRVQQAALAIALEGSYKSHELCSNQGEQNDTFAWHKASQAA
eukprot:GHRR01019420.1.p1 GENE.GHRR01019420.1~~GHRR01019420.1.p1  ORF type:complete len:734 (+),score=290.90 GHRR01019420.1:100-2301(+)